MLIFVEVNLDISFANNLTSLKELIIYSYLTSLPKSIGNLKSLEKLNIRFSRIKNLPESLGNLVSLKNLQLRENQLTSLPENIGNLVNLKDLNLNQNLVTFLPESIENLNSLENLDLGENPIKTLSYLSLNMLNHSRIYYNNLTRKGKILNEERRFDELVAYYSKTPNKLALQYISDPKSLTEDEMERLIHEMDKKDEKILESQLPLDDPLIKKIMERKSHKLSDGSKIYL